MRIGIMLPNWIGDLAMATPALRALRKHFADAELIGLVRPYAAEVLAGTTWLDRLIPWEHRGWQALPGNILTAWQLRQQRFDSFLLLRHSFTSALVARASGATRIVGYERGGGSRLLTDALPQPRSDGKRLPVSAVDSYLGIVYLLGCPRESRQLELRTTPEEEAAGAAILRELRIPADQPAIMLNTGGAYGGAKHWPVEHGAALARRAAKELGLRVIVNCGPAESAAADEIVRLAGHPHVTNVAHLPLPLRGIGPSKAVIRRMQLMVSTDSGPRHLAAALGVPTITLFGPIDPAWSTNYQPGGVKLRLDLPCAPCGKRVCPLQHQQCMRNLSADMVFAAVQRKLAAVPTEVAARVDDYFPNDFATSVR
jgi:heptosyltransferase II